MSDYTLQQLKDAYQDYFSLEHSININVKVLNSPLPDETQLLAAIPPPFLMVSDASTFNGQALRSLHRLSEVAAELSAYLEHQAKKVDMLLHYVLQLQNNPNEQFTTQSYGGSGCTFLSDTPMSELTVVEIKLFLANNDGAVFGFGQVVGCEKADDKWLISVVLNRLREEDRDLLVRASLHQQSRLLKQKADLRRQQNLS